MTTITAETAVQTLIAEGHSKADVESVLDQLINAGLEADQPEDGTVFTAEELDVAREQLASVMG